MSASTDFLPGFSTLDGAALDAGEVLLDAPAAILDGAASARGAARLPTGDYRARQYARFLTPAQRQAVARRARFYSMPFLRPANQPDADADGDTLP